MNQPQTVRYFNALKHPTRILRAVRYEQRFNFEIEPRTLELLRDAIELLDRVTPARIRHELERILDEPYPEKAMMRLQTLGILSRLNLVLHFDESLGRAFAELRAVRTRAHSHDIIRTEPIDRLYWGILVAKLPSTAHIELTERLGLRGETQKMMRGLAHLNRHKNELELQGLSPSRVVDMLDPVDQVSLALLPIIYAAHPQIVAYAQRYQSMWRNVQPELDGHDLAELGVPRGPLYSELLRSLRAARLDGVLLTRDDEIAYVRSYLRLP